MDLKGPGIHPPSQKLSEAEEVRRHVERENMDRVKEMTPEERAQEAEELVDRFGPGLAELMRKRREKRQAALVSGSSAPARPSTSSKELSGEQPSKSIRIKLT